MKGNTQVLVSLCILFLTENFAFFLPAPFLPEEGVARGLSSTEVGIIIATSPLFMFIFSPITGYLLRRGISERFILIGGTLMEITAYGAFASLTWASGYVVFFALACLFEAMIGIGCALTQTAALVLIALYFPENAGMARGILEIMTGVGCVLGPLMGGVLYHVGGFSLPFLVEAGFFVIGFVLLVITIRNKPPVPDQSSVRHGVNPGDAIPVVHSGGMGSELIDLSDGSVSEREDTKLALLQEHQMLNARGKRKGADSGEVTPNAAAARPWKRAKKRRRTLCQFMNNMWVILACFSVFNSLVTLSFLSATLSPELDEEYKVGPLDRGFMFGVAAVCYLVMAPICGKLTDILGATARRVIFLLGLSLSAFAMLMLGPSPALKSMGMSSGFVYLAMGILGGANSMSFIAPFKEILEWTDGSEEESPLASAVVTAAQPLGSVVGASLSGVMVDFLGFPWAATVLSCYLGFVVLLIISCISIRRITDRRGCTKPLRTWRELRNESFAKNGETRDLEGGGEDIGYGTITSNDRRRGSSGAGPVSNTSSVGNGYGYLHSLCSGSSSDDATGASSRRPAKGQLQASTKNSKHKTRRKKRRQSRGNASSTTMPGVKVPNYDEMSLDQDLSSEDGMSPL